MTFEENFYKKNMYIKIRNLYMDKKYKELIKEAENYLNIYSNDINIRFMYAKALRHEERFEEAIENFKINLKYNSHDEHSILSLFYLYYFLNMYKEAYEMLPLVYETKFQKKSISITKLVMRKNLGYPCYINEKENNNYINKQIVNYDSDLAYNHISEHTSLEEQMKNVKGSLMFNDIDLKYLISVVKENIPKNKKANIEEIMDIYYFGISNIGYDDNNIYNYIKVVVIPNTQDIVSIYPTNLIEEKTTKPLDCDHNKLFKRTNKVKTMSRIDKFKKKYNI